MAYVERRGDKWRVQVRVKGHPPVSKTFAKKVLADRWGRETELALASAPATVDPDVGKLAQRYLEEVLPLKPSGRTKRETIKFLAKRLAGVPLSTITPAWLLQYAQERKVAPSTLIQDVIFLGLVLETAEVLWEMPVDLASFKRGRATLSKHGLIAKSNERDRRVSDDEIEVLLKHARTKLPLRDLIAFSLASAMRVSEQMNLRWDDLDRANKTILIRDRKHPRVKLGNNQRVPLLGQAWEVIAKRKRAGDEVRVFPYKTDSVTAAFHRATVRAGIEDLRWHDLRHEAISRLFESRKYDIPEVALVSGHRSWEQLKRYTQIGAETLHR